jgi:DNA (cytosine-5)-methyltransferase 1
MKLLDLFSGIGGFSLGLERAGFETVAFCEFDTKAQLVLKKHWPDVPIYDDVRTLTAERLRADGVDHIDAICGGFPCQDISLAGKGAGLSGERSGLWFEYHRLIEEIRPSWVIIENVAALRSRGLDDVLRSLAEIGYDAEWHCIPASAVGAPHRRDRVWIVAYPCGSKRETRAEEPRILRALQEDGAVNDNASGRGEAYASDVAYSNNTGNRTPRHGADGNRPEIEQGRQEQSFDRVSGCSENATNTVCEGLEGQRTLAGRISEELKNARNSCGWAVEPDVGRVANGVPGRVDRLKQLGNAVVPQIPEIIGRAILEKVNEHLVP